MERARQPPPPPPSAAAAAPAAPIEPTPDHLGSLFSLLASVLDVAPQLFLDAQLRPEGRAVIGNFTTRCMNSDAMRLAAELRVPFLDMLTALAAGEDGAREVIRQLVEMGKVRLNGIYQRYDTSIAPAARCILHIPA